MGGGPGWDKERIGQGQARTDKGGPAQIGTDIHADVLPDVRRMPPINSGVFSDSTSPRATTTSQTNIWCNIFRALVLSHFCLPEWPRYCRCSIKSSSDEGRSCRCRPFDVFGQKLRGSFYRGSFYRVGFRKGVRVRAGVPGAGVGVGLRWVVGGRFPRGK